MAFKQRFCPKCGEDSETGDLCSRCNKETTPKKLQNKEVSIKYCTTCKKYYSSIKDVPTRNIEDLLQRIFRTFFPKGSSIGVAVPEHNPEHTGEDQELIVVIEQNSKKYHIPVELLSTTCKKCGRAGSNYYEGILQLRNARKEDIDSARKDIGKQKSKGFIAKEDPQKDGVDFYISSQSYLQALGLRLQKRFGGEEKTSAKIHGRDRMKSKDLYRKTILLTLPDWRKNDIIEIDDKLVKITNVGRQCTGFDLVKKRKATFYLHEKPAVLAKEKTTISKLYPRIEILHPKTYQSVPVANTLEGIQQGTNVKAVFWKNKWWLVQ